MSWDFIKISPDDYAIFNNNLFFDIIGTSAIF